MLVLLLSRSEGEVDERKVVFLFVVGTPLDERRAQIDQLMKTKTNKQTNNQSIININNNKTSKQTVKILVMTSQVKGHRSAD